MFEDFTLAIGFREDGGYRDLNLDWCLRWWNRHAPGHELSMADSDGNRPFSRSESRNQAVRNGTAPYLIIADADSVVEPENLAKAAALLREDRQSWYLPYEVYYNISQYYSSMVLVRGETMLEGEILYDHKIPSRISPPAVSGVILMTREMFEEIGGYDERFIGWGWEDNAFAIKARTLGGVMQRLPGNCYHLWHPAPEDTTFGSEYAEQNQRLFYQYQKAEGRPDKMREMQ